MCKINPLKSAWGKGLRGIKNSTNCFTFEYYNEIQAGKGFYMCEVENFDCCRI